jgi:hypothetical protein
MKAFDGPRPASEPADGGVAGDMPGYTAEMSALPPWVAYLQALGLPIFSAVLALVGGWIGWQNMQMSRVKLQHDLYERRFRIFDATRKLISEALAHNKADPASIREHAIHTADAEFLLDADMAAYLEKLRRFIDDLGNEMLWLEKSKGEERERLHMQHAEDYEWVRQQLAVLLDKFRPFLVLPKVRAFPWQ